GLVSVAVEYKNMVTENTDKLTSSVGIRFSQSSAKVDEDRDLETYAFCAVQIANERNVRATALRDAGQIDAAKKLLEKNQHELGQCALLCEGTEAATLIPELNRNIYFNRWQESKLDQPADWVRTRKAMRSFQAEIMSQQTYKGSVDLGNPR
ncbi:MAG: hypothetical protein MI861_08335, partial [Pirellulales bacterium]|nr:hypothetical protein [Pirellulales bacterium]